MFRTVLPALLVVLPWAVPSRADIVLDQPVDYQSFVRSDNWGGDIIQAGDDYVLPEGRPVRIDSVSFTMVVSWPNRPFDFTFEIYRTIPDDFWPWEWRPRYRPPDHRITGPSQVIDRGEWKGGGWNQAEHTLHEVEIVFDDLGITLDPGVSLGDRWFFSPVGHVTHPLDQSSYWATSGHGDLNWSEGWLKFVPFQWPGWGPIGNHRGFDPSDYAMTIEGTVLPAPGVLALLALGLLHTHRRRRRQQQATIN